MLIYAIELIILSHYKLCVIRIIAVLYSPNFKQSENFTGHHVAYAQDKLPTVSIVIDNSKRINYTGGNTYENMEMGHIRAR